MNENSSHENQNRIRRNSFLLDCRIFDIRREYTDYTGKEKYIIVSPYSKELLEKLYSEEIMEYSPYVLLDTEQGKTILEYRNLEAKFRMQDLRHRQAFSSIEYSQSLCQQEDIPETLIRGEYREMMYTGMKMLSEKQRRRLYKKFYLHKSIREIAKEEHVYPNAVLRSINQGLKTLRKNFQTPETS